MITPTFTRESKLLGKYQLIAGVDEVGRGPLAGPVVSAAVILDPLRVGKYRSKSKWWAGVRDSKLVPEERREALVEFIRDHAYDFAIGICSHTEIDELNIHYASLVSMKRAVENLKLAPQVVLVDGKFTVPFDRARAMIDQMPIVDGDAKVLSIAAASLLAKVFRDDIMKKYDQDFPQYGFARHKGYNTDFHRKAIVSYGPTKIHRMTFPAMQSIISKHFENLKARR